MPQHGQIIRFTKVPPGSYCSEGEAYHVEHRPADNSYRFVNIKTGGATSDKAVFVRMARWEEA